MLNKQRRNIALLISAVVILVLSTPLAFNRAYQMQIYDGILAVSYNTQTFSAKAIKKFNDGMSFSDAFRFNINDILDRLSQATKIMVEAHGHYRYNVLLREVDQLEVRLRAERLRQTMSTSTNAQTWNFINKSYIDYTGFKNNTLNYMDTGVGATRREASIWQARVDSYAAMQLMKYIDDGGSDHRIKNIQTYYPYVSYWLKPYLEDPTSMRTAFYRNQQVNGISPRDLMFKRLRSDNVGNNSTRRLQHEQRRDLESARLYHGTLGDMFGLFLYHPQHDWRYTSTVTENLNMNSKVSMEYFYDNQAASLFNTHEIGQAPYWEFWKK